MTVTHESIQSGPVAIGNGFSVEMVFANGGCTCVWSPVMPTPAQGRPLLPAYQSARNAFLARVADVLSINIGVVDLPARKGGVS